MTRREQGNLAGWSSVAASAISWFCGLLIRQNWWFPGGWFFYALMTLGLLGVVLPIVAGFRGSKLWFLMILSPLIGYIVILAHTCG